MSADEDEADVARVMSGDVSAFEGIVRRWQGPLIGLAYRFCGDRARAEDMAQEAFLRVFRSLAHWRREAAFSSWLIAVAANVYRTELRRTPVRSVPLDDVDEPGAADRTEARMLDEDRDRAVRRAVRSLAPRYRDAIVLYYFHDRDVPATARTLGVPEGTVKARLARARELLRGKVIGILGTPRWNEA